MEAPIKINVNVIVRHPSGMALKSTPDERDDKGNVTKEGEDMTVADVLVTTALQPSPPNKTYTPRQQVIRYQLALDAWKAKENLEDPTMYVSQRALKEIEDDLSRIYTPVVGGQILLMLGYVLPEEDEDPEPPRASEDLQRKLRPGPALARSQK